MNHVWAVVGTDDDAVGFIKKLKLYGGSNLAVVVAEKHLDAFLFAKQYGVASYSNNFRDLINNQNITAVFISEIDLSNLEFIIECTENGKEIYCNQVLLSNGVVKELSVLTNNIHVLQ